MNFHKNELGVRPFQRTLMLPGWMPWMPWHAGSIGSNKPNRHPPTLGAVSVAFPGFSRPWGRCIYQQERPNQIIHRISSVAVDGQRSRSIRLSYFDGSPLMTQTISVSIHIICKTNSSQARIEYMSGRVPERMPGKMSKSMSNRVPERIVT